MVLAGPRPEETPIRVGTGQGTITAIKGSGLITGETPWLTHTAMPLAADQWRSGSSPTSNGTVRIQRQSHRAGSRGAEELRESQKSAGRTLRQVDLRAHAKGSENKVLGSWNGVPERALERLVPSLFGGESM
jgi:hypothetical protein